MKRIFLVFGVMALVLVPALGFGSTTIKFDTYLNGFTIDTTEANRAAGEFSSLVDKFFNTNDKVIPSGFAMTNTLGYPNGKSAIKQFPHFECGVAAGGGILEADRRKNYSKENPHIPFIGVNGGAHFGTGITNRFDITGKFFNIGWFGNLNKSFKKEDNNTNEPSSTELKIEKMDIYSFGVKGRYNLVPRITLIPVLFSFGGISLNCGFDYMHGDVRTSLGRMDTKSLTVKFSSIDYTLKGTANYNTAGGIKWDIYSITPEMLMYLDIIYFFSFYFGPSVSVNWGDYQFNMQGRGGLKTGENIGPITKNTDIATLTVDSNYKMRPYTYIPKFTVGLEINLWVLKLQAEVISILSSPKESAMAQVGVRMQF